MLYEILYIEARNKLCLFSSIIVFFILLFLNFLIDQHIFNQRNQSNKSIKRLRRIQFSFRWIKQKLTYPSKFLMLLEIEVENLQNTVTEVSKMRQYSVSLCLHPWQEVF
ncbi:conserved domain protein [Parasutterella excrementihominis YIT 11859]|uniref:Conserved domain protein n=1 Tax=Parasutterella excrementihominis YIT 11859 TaxID=762966 RepID=F3QI08_9BURK|nr:conserved domain protein [Parasutterella excrementihominis YIT 11859]